MSERDGFMQSIITDAGDDTPRLVFADWLEEHGDEPRAEFIRVQCAVARGPGVTISPTEARALARSSDVRDYLKWNPNALMSLTDPVNPNRRCGLPPTLGGVSIMVDESAPVGDRVALNVVQRAWHEPPYSTLRDREWELFDEWAGRWWFSHPLHLIRPNVPQPANSSADFAGVVLSPDHDYLGAQLVIARGFIDHLVCTHDDFFRAAGGLVWRKYGFVETPKTSVLPPWAQPIRSVRLTTEPQMIHLGDGHFSWEGWLCPVPDPLETQSGRYRPSVPACLNRTFPDVSFVIGRPQPAPEPDSYDPHGDLVPGTGTGYG